MFIIMFTIMFVLVMFVNKIEIPVYKGPSTDSPLSVCAQCVYMLLFLHVALVSCCTFCILHHFNVALFCVVIFSCCNFLCVTLFIYCTISCCPRKLQCFRFAFFSCYALRMLKLFSCSTLFILHNFQRCSYDPHKHLRWRALQ